MAKKFITIAFVIALSADVYAQGPWGVKAGFNLNDIHTKGFTTHIHYPAYNLFGFHAGLFSKIGLKEKLAFSPELQFTQRGYNFGTVKRMIFNYLELPLLLSYSPVSRFSIDGGINVSYLLSATATTRDLYNEPVRTKQPFYLKTDAGLMAGFSLRLIEKLAFTGRYYWGLRPISEVIHQDQNGNTITTVKEYNRNAQLGLAYTIR